MMLFIDTSAFLAVLNADDINHAKAKKKWESIITEKYSLICSNYILLETTVLIQRRFGIQALRAFQENVHPLLNVQWINENIHQIAISMLLTADRRHLSIVDCTSFEIMRKQGIEKVFCFDKHFKEQGFDLI